MSKLSKLKPMQEAGGEVETSLDVVETDLDVVMLEKIAQDEHTSKREQATLSSAPDKPRRTIARVRRVTRVILNANIAIILAIMQVSARKSNMISPRKVQMWLMTKCLKGINKKPSSCATLLSKAVMSYGF